MLSWLRLGCLSTVLPGRAGRLPDLEDLESSSETQSACQPAVPWPLSRQGALGAGQTPDLYGKPDPEEPRIAAATRPCHGSPPRRRSAVVCGLGASMAPGDLWG